MPIQFPCANPKCRFELVVSGRAAAGEVRCPNCGLVQAAPRVEALQAFLAPDRPDLPRLALKFCLSNPAVTTVIPGMRSPAHVEKNVSASDGRLLDAKTLDELRAHAFVHGWSYPWAA